MEELHRIHKDVPFCYWAFWVQPAWNALRRRRLSLPAIRRGAGDARRARTA